MKVNITILSMYQNKISIHSVFSISLTQTILSDLMLVVGRCRDIANNTLYTKIVKCKFRFLLKM